MSYKRYLFETGGYQAYEYALDSSGSTDDQKQSEIHNSLRNAAASVVGLITALSSTLRVGARVAAETKQTENFHAINSLVGGMSSANQVGSENPSVVATQFAKTAFTSIRKEGNDTVALITKTFESHLIIDPNNPEQEDLLESIIPGYRTPKEFERISSRAIPKFAEGNLAGSISQDALLKLLKGPASTLVPSYVLQSDDFSAVKPLPKGMGVMLNVRLRPGTYTSSIAGMPFSVSQVAESGAIPRSAAIRVDVDIVAELHVPTSYAYWSMYCESKDEFVPFMFMTHLNSLIRAAGGYVEDKSGKSTAEFNKELKGRNGAAWKKATARKPTPIAMARRNRAKEKSLDYVPKIRTDENGYIISARNRIFRLPTEGKMTEYQSAANEWFETLTEQEIKKLSDSTIHDRDRPKFKFKPSVLYVDHHNEVMVFTTLEGAVTSYNLRGARPLDDITIAKRYPEAFATVMNGGAFQWTSELIDQIGDDGRILYELFYSLSRNKYAANIAKAVAAGAALPPTATNPIRTEFEDSNWAFIATAFRSVHQYNSDEELAFRSVIRNVTSGSPEEQERAEIEIITMLNRGMVKIAQVARKHWASGALREEEGGVINNQTADAAAYIVGVHTATLPLFDLERRTNLRENVVDSLDRDKPIAIPNIDTERMSFVFPHQGEFIQAVDRDKPPKSAVIGAAPGGGKTNAILADILLLLSKGLIKRPVVTVPNNLVKQFVSEINEFTNGKVNAFPLTYQHVRDVLMNPYGFNMTTAEIIKYLRELPRNTIIVTNYNTLRNTFSDFPDAYSTVGSYDNFGRTKPLKAYPFVDMLAAAGMDYICGDESHKIKNQDSDMAQAFLALCAKAEYVRLSSGTTINNVVTDLVGQMQKINPAILGGDVEEFAEDYLGSAKAKQVSTPEQADAISEAMREYSLVMQKDSRSWDYMLPKMQEMYHRVSMTELQNRYYSVLFSKAINRIQEEAKGDLEKTDKGEDDPAVSSKIERVVAKHFSVIDRFVNDPTQFTDFVDGSFVYEEFAIKNNGEEADPGTLDLAIPEKEDLISVKAAFAYELLYAHMDEKGALARIRQEGGAQRWQPDPTNKVIIMAPNKFVGNHVWNNMPADLKSRAVRYQAGAFDKVEQFKTDDTIRFMVADEVSISEGHNLQVGSRIIRMQQVWTPGSETQSLARIRRPDPFGKYNRDALGYDIIVATRPSGAPTIDDLRIARLLAKKFNNAMVEFGYELSFRNEFFKGDIDPLPPISMSMDTIKSFPEEMLNKYFDQQRRFNTWFATSSAAETLRIGREVESITGQKLLDDNGRPINIKDFVAAVVVPTVPTPDMQGTASCYVPWLPSVHPINPLGFDMEPLRSVMMNSASEDDEDEDDEEEEDDSPDNVQVSAGDYVMTEFGPAIVIRPLRNGHKLELYIPSMPSDNKKDKYKRVRLPKTCIYAPIDEKGAKILAAAITGKAGQPTKPPKSKGVTPDQRKKADERKRGSDKPPVDFTDYEADDEFDEDDFDVDALVTEDDEEDDEPEDPIDVMIEDEEEFEDDEEEEEDDGEEVEPSIFAQALAINGNLAVVADDQGDGSALDLLFSGYGFKRFPDMVRVEFKTRKALDSFLARLSIAKFAIPRNLMLEIETIATGINSRGKLEQLQPFDYAEVTNFMKTEQRKVPKRPDANTPQTIRLYPIVMRGKFYLCGSLDKHPFNITNVLNKLGMGIPGCGKPQKRDNMGVKFYASMTQAKSEAKKIIKDGTIIEPTEGVQSFLDSFDDIRGGHIEMPKAAPVKPAAVVTETKPTPVPGTKPKLKPSSAPAPTNDGYEEESHNPAVEDLEEFKTFLGARRATVMLVRGGDDDIRGIPLRVRSHGRNGFSVSTSPDEPKSEWLRFGIPANAVFDDEAGTMRVGKSLWRLSYAAK